MVILSAESSKGAPSWGDGHGGAGSGSGVPDNEAANGPSQNLLQRMIGGDGEAVDMRALTRIPMYWLELGQSVYDLGEESRTAVGRAHFAWQCSHLAQGVGVAVGVDASGSILVVHRNVFGGTSVHVASRAGTYVYVAPGGEVYMAVGVVTQVTAGGGPIPLLQSSHPVGAPGTINGAPRSSQDGVAGHWPPTFTDAFPTGDGGSPYWARPPPAGSPYWARPPPAGSPYWARPPPAADRAEEESTDATGTINGAPQSSQDGVAGHWALTVTDAFPTGDGGPPYVGGGALAVTDVFPARDGGTPCLARAAFIPFVRNAGIHHVINIPPAAEESTDATTVETDRARKFLEKLLFTLLPACVVALGPLSDVPDYAKLTIYIIMTVLIVLLVVGLSSRACTKHVVRLAICAGIFAMTVFVSVQYSQGIYVAVAGLVGVALSGITLAV